jgi:SM-20-related protein
MEADTQSWPDLFTVRQFFDVDTCERLIAEMVSVDGVPATVYGRTTSGVVDERTRRTLRLSPSPDSLTLVKDQLESFKRRVEEHFGVALKEVEEPQFLRYREGDFFVAHQDGNTGLLRLETESRLVSVVIFLSRESESPESGSFCGGSLVFSHLRFGKFRFPAEIGTLVAFRSETTHEVTPVLHGDRLSIACWYC